MSLPADGDWVSITEAAARLTAAGDVVDRSTLSRYLGQHGAAIPTRREGRSNLVDYATLAAHRGENIRLRRPAAAPAAPSRLAAPARFSGSKVDGVARKAQADAELRELDLAERRGHLTPTVEVDRAARESVALMQAAFDRAVENEAAALAIRYGWDERVARIALKGFVRRGLETFHRDALDWLARRAADAPDGATACAS